MPHQVFSRNFFVLTSFGSYTEVDILDSGLDDEAGAQGAGFGAVDGVVAGVDAGEVEVSTDGLLAGAV